MRRIIATVMMAGLAVNMASGAMAQASHKIPIEHDLRRWDATERRIDARRAPPFDLSGPPVDPGNVPGFNGPPGIVGESVGSYGPLPPGAAGNEEW